MSTRPAFTVLAALSLAGCIIEEPVPYEDNWSDDWGYDDDDPDDGGSNGDPQPDEDAGGEDWVPDTFILSGKVHNLLSTAEGGEGLCVTVVDPAPTFDNGSALKVLAQGEVLSDSTWRIEGVPLLTQGLGALVVLDDCETDLQDSALAAGSHLPQRVLNQVEAGETLRNFKLYLIDDTGRDLLQEAFGLAGHPGEWSEQGVLMGFVVNKDGFPVEGAEVGAETSGMAYYLSQDITLRTEGGTDADVGAMFAIPAAPLDWYSASVPSPEGGEGTEGEIPETLGFEEHYVGALPDMAIFISLMEL